MAIVDPELTYSLPPLQTATSGLDALTQLIEPFLSNASNPITDAVCREGIRRVVQSLHRAYQNGRDPRAREDMSLGSLMSGMALANAKLGAVHGFAGPIGGMYPAPHGGICAKLLPIMLEVNLNALREKAGEAVALERFSMVGRLLTGNPRARPEDAIRWLQELCDSLHIPALAAYGVREALPRNYLAGKKGKQHERESARACRPRIDCDHGISLVSSRRRQELDQRPAVIPESFLAGHKRDVSGRGQTVNQIGEVRRLPLLVPPAEEHRDPGAPVARCSAARSGSSTPKG